VPDPSWNQECLLDRMDRGQVHGPNEAEQRLESDSLRRIAGRFLYLFLLFYAPTFIAKKAVIPFCLIIF
jgi:hypothetical protein